MASNRKISTKIQYDNDEHLVTFMLPTLQSKPTSHDIYILGGLQKSSINMLVSNSDYKWLKQNLRKSNKKNNQITFSIGDIERVQQEPGNESSKYQETFYFSMRAAIEYLLQVLFPLRDKSKDERRQLTAPGTPYAQLLKIVDMNLNQDTMALESLKNKDLNELMEEFSSRLYDVINPVAAALQQEKMAGNVTDEFITLYNYALKYAKKIKKYLMVMTPTTKTKEMLAELDNAIMVIYVQMVGKYYFNNENYLTYFPILAELQQMFAKYDEIMANFDGDRTGWYSSEHFVATVCIENGYPELAMELAGNIYKHVQRIQRQASMELELFLENFADMADGKIVFQKIGDHFFKQKAYDKALYWYQCIVDLQLTTDKTRLELIYRSIADAYRLKGDLINTRMWYLRIIDLVKDDKKKATTYASLASLFEKQIKEKEQEQAKLSAVANKTEEKSAPQMTQASDTVSNDPNNNNSEVVDSNQRASTNSKTEVEEKEIKTESATHDLGNQLTLFTAKAYPKPERKVLADLTDLTKQKKPLNASPINDSPTKNASPTKIKSPPIDPTIFGAQFANKEIVPIRTDFMTNDRVIFYGYYDDSAAINDPKFNEPLALERHRALFNNGEIYAVTKGAGVRMFSHPVDGKSQTMFKTVVKGSKKGGSDMRMWSRLVSQAKAKDKDGYEYTIYLYAFDQPLDHDKQKQILKIKG